ncbi:MAG: hypothetical protein AB7G17_07315 [Phycisphaerales bacterium]
MQRYTEQQVEDWLTREKRRVTLPDGSARAVTAFRLTWGKAEALAARGVYSIAELVGYAIEESVLQGITLDDAFHCVVGWLDNERRDGWGG